MIEPSKKSGPEAGRPITIEKRDTTVWEPESLKKAREVPGLTEEQARRAQRQNKGQPVR